MSENTPTLRVRDVMTERVMTITRSQTIGHVRELMSKHGVHSFPVVDGEGVPIGIVTSTDLVDPPDDQTRVGDCMSG